jgi:hypothetical protein
MIYFEHVVLIELGLVGSRVAWTRQAWPQPDIDWVTGTTHNIPNI